MKIEFVENAAQYFQSKKLSLSDCQEIVCQKIILQNPSNVEIIKKFLNEDGSITYDNDISFYKNKFLYLWTFKNEKIVSFSDSIYYTFSIGENIEAILNNFYYFKSSVSDRYIGCWYNYDTRYAHIDNVYYNRPSLYDKNNYYGIPQAYIEISLLNDIAEFKFPLEITEKNIIELSDKEDQIYICNSCNRRTTSKGCDCYYSVYSKKINIIKSKRFAVATTKCYDINFEIPIFKNNNTTFLDTRSLLIDFKSDDDFKIKLFDLFSNKNDNKSFKKVEIKFKEQFLKLEKEEPILFSFFNCLKSSKDSGGISNNSLLSKFIEYCASKSNDVYDNIVSELKQAFDKFASKEHQFSSIRDVVTLLPGAKDRLNEKEAKIHWHLQNSLSEQAEKLGIEESKYPKLKEAILNSKIPLSLFHEPSDKNSLTNTEFLLLEKALLQEGWAEVIYKIADAASSRKRFEKEITLYLAFLFKLPRYLEKHTGKKWTGMPKLVESEWQLEMEEPNEEGTVKRKSALTPSVDNEKCIVTVPYTALATHGRQTTYCYSLDYQVFEEYEIDRESNTPILSDLEEKLNGRDDYGLMYYTFTGSSSNRGYPTFLIIFERKSNDTTVHFHRTHPCRLTNGQKTPAHKLIQECYRNMCGNIRASEVIAQQGDLILINVEDLKENFGQAKSVAEFESHKFVSKTNKPILLIENTSKTIKNRLGHICCAEQFRLEHPEHEFTRWLDPGIYEIRRTKSFEANPKAVWSLVID